MPIILAKRRCVEWNFRRMSCTSHGANSRCFRGPSGSFSARSGRLMAASGSASGLGGGPLRLSAGLNGSGKGGRRGGRETCDECVRVDEGRYGTDASLRIHSWRQSACLRSAPQMRWLAQIPLPSWRSSASTHWKNSNAGRAGRASGYTTLKRPGQEGSHRRARAPPVTGRDEVVSVRRCTDNDVRSRRASARRSHRQCTRCSRSTRITPPLGSLAMLLSAPRLMPSRIVPVVFTFAPLRGTPCCDTTHSPPVRSSM